MENKRNLWVIPTDKPSRLYLTTHEYIFEEGYSLSTDECQNKHIYITSDEEIKEGDWFIALDGSNDIYKANKVWLDIIKENTNPSRKIILTTDQDLIADGVQPIDDEFLEWFVKNPSCEEVDFTKIYLSNNGQWKEVLLPSEWEVDTKVAYKIIIPKEEPKQEDEFCYYSGLPSPAAYLKEEIKLEEVFNDDKKENIKKFIDEINNPSQPNDKLKQAFEKYSEYLEDYENKNTYEHGFKDGAKCQQEIMYSEEEVEDLIYKVCGTVARLQGITINGNHLDTAYKQHKKK